MKILYSAGNRIGAASQLTRFLESVKDGHEIKIAAYLKSSSIGLSNVDWTLDALFHPFSGKKSVSSILGYTGAPKVNHILFEKLIEDIDNFSPDLVICDGEPIISNIAFSLNLRLWYCSPLHLIDGIMWEKKQKKYQALLDLTRKMLMWLPKPDKYFIYSPWGDNINNLPIIKEEYEWIQPYFIQCKMNSGAESIVVCPDYSRINKLTRIFNSLSTDIKVISESNINCLQNCNYYFSAGETSYLSDALYNNISNICLIPNLQDSEALLNVIMCERCNWAKDVGQLELINTNAVDYLYKIINNNLNLNKESIKIGLNKTLTQKVEEYARLF